LYIFIAFISDLGVANDKELYFVKNYIIYAYISFIFYINNFLHQITKIINKKNFS